MISPAVAMPLPSSSSPTSPRAVATYTWLVVEDCDTGRGKVAQIGSGIITTKEGGTIVRLPDSRKDWQCQPFFRPGVSMRPSCAKSFSRWRRRSNACVVCVWSWKGVAVATAVANFLCSRVTLPRLRLKRCRVVVTAQLCVFFASVRFVIRDP